jgi:hypothetical protein
MGNSEEYMPEGRRNPGPSGEERLFTGDLKIQVWRNSADQDWSVEINNKRYSSIPFQTVQERVAQALKDAKKSLMERRTNKTC